MPKSFLILCLLLGSALAGTPDAVLGAIQDRGAKAVVLRMAVEPDFEEEVLAGVSSGTANWVEVGAELLPHADASISQGLASSFADALIHSPERVLALVNSSPAFRAKRICLPFMSAEEPSKLHLAHLRRLDVALSRVSAPSLQAAKAACTHESMAMRRLLRK